MSWGWWAVFGAFIFALGTAYYFTRLRGALDRMTSHIHPPPPEWYEQEYPDPLPRRRRPF